MVASVHVLGLQLANGVVARSRNLNPVLRLHLAHWVVTRSCSVDLTSIRSLSDFTASELSRCEELVRGHVSLSNMVRNGHGDVSVVAPVFGLGLDVGCRLVAWHLVALHG